MQLVFLELAFLSILQQVLFYEYSEYILCIYVCILITSELILHALTSNSAVTFGLSELASNLIFDLEILLKNFEISLTTPHKIILACHHLK